MEIKRGEERVWGILGGVERKREGLRVRKRRKQKGERSWGEDWEQAGRGIERKREELRDGTEGREKGGRREEQWGYGNRPGGAEGNWEGVRMGNRG